MSSENKGHGFSFIPGTKYMRDGRRVIARTHGGWLVALEGHTRVTHGESGKTVPGCPACKELTERIEQTQ